LLLGSLLITTLSALSQEKIYVKNVSGNCIISSNLTLEQAKEKAIKEAKIEALRIAGIPQNITSTEVLTTSENNQNFEQAFNSFSNIEIQGTVLEPDTILENKFIDEFGNFIIEVSFNATVLQYETKPDPSFAISVKGIRDYYENNGKITFFFKPFEDGYLKIFLFNDNNEGFIIYPNNYEANRLFTKNKTVDFPLMPQYLDYIVETSKQREIDHLVFVFTRESIPFEEKVNVHNILNWIYSIEPNQRVVKYFQFVIVNNM